MKKAYAGFTKYNKPYFNRPEPQKRYSRRITVQSIRVNDEDELPLIPEGHKGKFRVDYGYGDDKEFYIDIFREEFFENKRYDKEIEIWRRAKKRFESKIKLWNEWYKDFEKNEAERIKEKELNLLQKLKAKYEQ